jgi:hypothetical protein
MRTGLILVASPLSSRQSEPMMRDPGRAVRLQLIGLITLCLVVAATVAAWVLRASAVDHWLAVHTGTNNVSGAYYGFWSGFGSDLAEFGILGAIGTGVYQARQEIQLVTSPGVGESEPTLPRTASSTVLPTPPRLSGSPANTRPHRSNAP